MVALSGELDGRLFYARLTRRGGGGGGGGGGQIVEEHFLNNISFKKVAKHLESGCRRISPELELQF